MVLAAEQLTGHGDCLVSAYPNAGLPEYADGRYLFGAPLPYLVESAARNKRGGADGEREGAGTGGRIICVSATFHYTGQTLQAHVSAAKAGVDRPPEA